MKRTFISMLALIFAASISAQAAEEASPEAKASVTKALEGAGCTGDAIKAEGDGYFVNNAKCQDGKYDITLDKDFKIVDKEKEN